MLEIPQDDENTSTYIVADGDQPVDRERVIRILGLDDERFYNPATCEFIAPAERRWRPGRAIR